jgi:hypothetical protein
MSAIYRMEVCGWTRDEAVEEMKSFGFSGRYQKLLRYVQAYSCQSAPVVVPNTAVAPSAAATKPAAAALATASN